MDQQTGRYSMGDRKGQALVITAAGLITVLGLAALAVDVGMLYTAHGEAQRSAAQTLSRSRARARS
jgi:uncharacterized membrane protein